MGRADDWSLHEIFKNKNPNVFKIPIYQRGYDWEAKHIDDFWEDLIEADLTQGGKSGNHFFGLIYTEEERDAQNAILANFHRVIDGQQRLTTTAIFFLCAKFINLYPGSLIQGVPASDIKAILSPLINRSTNFTALERSLFS